MMGWSARATYAIIQFLLGIVCLVIGVIFLNECPVERMIPVFLVVLGAVNIVIVLLAFLQSCCYDEDRESDLSCWRVLLLVVAVFSSAWFIAGSYWVYSNYHPHYNPGPKDKPNPEYCDKVLYLFSFWVINLTYMFFVILLLAAIVIYVCMPDIWSQMWGY